MKVPLLFFLSSLHLSVVNVFAQKTITQVSTANKYVLVDGHKMHYQVGGTGRPTVVFEGGVTDDLNSWNPVFSDVTGFTQAVRYDRMGLGSSDTATTPRTFRQMATDLHSMLHIAQILPPYIFVGHSMGGPLIRAFAHLYKDEIAGMVFIDCMTELDVDGFSKDSVAKNLPPETVSERSTPQESELYLLRTEVLSGYTELRSFDRLPEVPVHVFVGQKKLYPPIANNRIEWYRKFVSDESESSLTVLPASSHYIHRDYPGLIVSAIQDMIYPNPDVVLKTVLVDKGADSCVAQYKRMKLVYPGGLITEGTLNKLGYDALSRRDVRGAIKLFLLNVVTYPKSFNVYDSLAEAYMKAGNRKEAIKNYKRSLQLNPSNKNAVIQMNKLK